jgi:hypothetical protein
LIAKYTVSSANSPTEMAAGKAYTFHRAEATLLDKGRGWEAKYAPREGLKMGLARFPV